LVGRKISMNFVVTGLPRSGTTILSRMLNQVPGLCCTHELMTWMPDGFKPDWKDRIRSTEIRLQSKLKDINVLKSPHFDRSQFLEMVKRTSPWEAANRQGLSYGDKSPDYCRNIPAVIEKAGPDAPWVFIYRKTEKIVGSLMDGYAGYCSTDWAKKSGIMKRDSIDEGAAWQMVKDYMVAWDRDRGNIKNLFIVEYEMLSESFPWLVERLCFRSEDAKRIVGKMFKERRK